MQVFSKIADLTKKYPRPAVALGTFDGVHLGHQSIIRRAIELAREAGGVSMVFTFSNHPLAVLAPKRQPPQIGDNDSRAEILAAMGVDVLVCVPFTKDFSQLSPEDFLELLKNNFAPAYVVVGPNYTFGSRGKGSGRMLIREAANYGFVPEVCPAVLSGGRPISSTRIRELIEAGELAGAEEFLGRPFMFSGRVVHGDRRGRSLGFPTANLLIPQERAMLPNGAYAARAKVGGQIYNALANIGHNPTFVGERAKRLEVNIQDFAGDIYNQLLMVEFLHKLRDEVAFPSVDHLVRQLNRDREAAALYW